MRFLPEITQDFGTASPGMWFANTIVCASARAFVACGFLLSGCLVTDTIELPPEPNGAPKLSSSYPPGYVIRFDSSRPRQELLISIAVSDEDTQETLIPRWRVQTANAITVYDYKCPEEPILGTGGVKRQDYLLNIPAAKFTPGTCNTIDVAVSSNFRPCSTTRPEFDVTVEPEQEATVGRIQFMVWETSQMPFVNPENAGTLIRTCLGQDYQTPTPTVGSR